MRFAFHNTTQLYVDHDQRESFKCKNAYEYLYHHGLLHKLNYLEHFNETQNTYTHCKQSCLADLKKVTRLFI